MNLLKLRAVADAMASLSKDPSTQVGAIVVDDDANILTTGYNGFPRGVKDHDYRYKDRDEKLKFVSHAEANAIAQAARLGAKLHGSTMILTSLYPCSNCAKLIIQAGIKKVYAPKMSRQERNFHWFQEAKISETMFNEAGVEVEVYE